MSIASEIARLQTAKSDLKTAIENKGVTVPSATKLDGYASLVNQISGSSAYNVTLVSLIPNGNETITYTGDDTGTINIVNGSGSAMLQAGTYTFTSADTIWTSGSVAISTDTSINCWNGTPLIWYGYVNNSALTGGWQTLAWKWSASAYGISPTMTYGTNFVNFYCTSGNGAYATKTTIDLSAYNILSIYAQHKSNSNSNINMLINPTVGTGTVNNISSSQYVEMPSSNKTLHQTDFNISSFTSNYYVTLWGGSASNITNCDIYAWWLE